jgi:DNA-binding MarR family transcriptional regulator
LTGIPPPVVAAACPPVDDGEVTPGGVGFLLGVAHRSSRRAWEATIADLGLTAPQAALLRLVAARPGSGVRQLARELSTDAMNVQRLAETLIAAGLCEARRDPTDARRRPLHPSAEGRRRAQVLARRAEAVEQDLLDALGADRYQALVVALRDVAAVRSAFAGSASGSAPEVDDRLLRRTGGKPRRPGEPQR